MAGQATTTTRRTVITETTTVTTSTKASRSAAPVTLGLEDAIEDDDSDSDNSGGDDDSNSDNPGGDDGDSDNSGGDDVNVDAEDDDSESDESGGDDVTTMIPDERLFNVDVTAAEILADVRQVLPRLDPSVHQDIAHLEGRIHRKMHVETPEPLCLPTIRRHPETWSRTDASMDGVWHYFVENEALNQLDPGFSFCPLKYKDMHAYISTLSVHGNFLLLIGRERVCGIAMQDCCCLHCVRGLIVSKGCRNLVMCQPARTYICNIALITRNCTQ